MASKGKSGLEMEPISGAVAGDIPHGMVAPATGLTATHAPENATLAACPTQPRADPPWLRVAKAELGTREVLGSGDNPRIVAYHKTTTLAANDDEVPWCSSFINWVMLKSHMERTNSAAARSWMNWGYALEEPIYGCLVVLKRQGGNHVGFFIKKEGKRVFLLGGNQSDAVNVASFDEGLVMGYRWPKGYAE